MVLPLMLWAGLVLGQTPDFLDIQTTPTGGYQVLAGGGLVYHWSGRSEMTLEAQLGTPVSAVYACEQGRLAVGPRGQVHLLSAQGQRSATLEGGADLWAVAGAGCERVLLAGEGGLWQGSLAGGSPVFQRLAVPTRLPLYGVATGGERTVVVGAGGTVLLRRSASGAFTPVVTHTTAPLLAVVLREGERYVVAGVGGLWRGEAEALRQVHTDESEVFTRVVFEDERVGIALGQRTVLATSDGGEHWRVLTQASLLGAVALGKGRFLGVGHGGAWRMLDALESDRGSSPALKVPMRLVPEKKPKPSSRPKPAPPPVPAPVAEAPPPEVFPELPPPGPECVWKLDKKMPRGDVFFDVKRLGDRVLVVGGDGSVRLSEGERLRTVYKVEDPLQGLTVAADGRRIAAVGFDVLVLSTDGGKSFRAQRTPAEGAFFAAAFAGEHLLLFDEQGRGWRSVSGERFEEFSLPRKVAFSGAAFVDARRGYLAGECGTLMETLDGGATWKVLPQPVKTMIQGVVAEGDTLYVSGEEGVWRSDDRGRTFRRLFKLPCTRVAREGIAVAAACGSGQTTEALHYAADGLDFRPVSVAYAHALMSVALMPGGDIYAVGLSQQFIRARPSGGVIAHHSAGIEKWKVVIDDVRRPLRQAPPKAPPTRVAVAPLSPP